MPGPDADQNEKKIVRLLICHEDVFPFPPGASLDQLLERRTPGPLELIILAFRQFRLDSQTEFFCGPLGNLTDDGIRHVRELAERSDTHSVLRNDIADSDEEFAIPEEGKTMRRIEIDQRTDERKTLLIQERTNMTSFHCTDAQ